MSVSCSINKKIGLKTPHPMQINRLWIMPTVVVPSFSFRKNICKNLNFQQVGPWEELFVWSLVRYSGWVALSCLWSFLSSYLRLFRVFMRLLCANWATVAVNLFRKWFLKKKNDVIIIFLLLLYVSFLPFYLCIIMYIRSPQIFVFLLIKMNKLFLKANFQCLV